MPRIIIARSHEWADGTISRMLNAFQAQGDAKSRQVWIAEQEERIKSAKINLFLINEIAREYDKRCINLPKGEVK